MSTLSAVPHRPLFAAFDTRWARLRNYLADRDFEPQHGDAARLATTPLALLAPMPKP